MGSIELEIVLGMGSIRIEKKKKKKKGNRKKGNRKKQKQKTTPVKGRTGMFYSTDWIFQNTNSSRQTMIEHDYTYHRILLLLRYGFYAPLGGGSNFFFSPNGIMRILIPSPSPSGPPPLFFLILYVLLNARRINAV